MELVDMRDLGSRAAMRVGSSPTRRTKTKGHPYGCPFVLGFGGRRPPKPFGISMLGGNKVRLRQGFHLRRKRSRGAKAPPARRPVRIILSKRCRKSKISILTVPAKKHLQSRCFFFVPAAMDRRHPPPAQKIIALFCRRLPCQPPAGKNSEKQRRETACFPDEKAV